MIGPVNWQAGKLKESLRDMPDPDSKAQVTARSIACFQPVFGEKSGTRGGIRTPMPCGGRF
ncbi:hypothetical protein ASAP_0938 [Asaia bogorensis]|uniref:Uncharacterized protein n=1 Tax=Asaia bogorensis TaxID=91915 RepID=A0A060QE53_9PROT|nr:hypothetical protein ASAP_0938 [Asaia bogorensis]